MLVFAILTCLYGGADWTCRIDTQAALQATNGATTLFHTAESCNVALNALPVLPEAAVRRSCVKKTIPVWEPAN